MGVWCEECNVFRWECSAAWTGHKDMLVKKYEKCDICKCNLIFPSKSISQYLGGYGSRISSPHNNLYNFKDYEAIPNNPYFINPPQIIRYYEEKEKPDKCRICKIDKPKESKLLHVYPDTQYCELCENCLKKELSLEEPPIQAKIEYQPSGGNFNNMNFCYHCALLKTVTSGTLGIAQVHLGYSFFSPFFRTTFFNIPIE